MKQRVRTSMSVLLAAASGLVASTVGAAPPDEPSFLLSGPRYESVDGAYLYRAVCQGCHMADGKGAQGASLYPSLAENPRLAASMYPALVVMNGMKGMPALSDVLGDAQVAAVVNHVRSHFGNAYEDTLTAEQVEGLRKR